MSNVSVNRAAAVLLLGGMLVAGCSKSAADYVASGDAYVKDGKHAEAVIEYRNAVQQNATDGQARLKLATAYEKAGQMPQAFREYVRAADLLPKDAAVQIKAGTLLWLAGRHEDAKARAQRALELDASNVEAQLLLGNATAGLRDLDGALREIQEAVALAPDNASTYSSLGAVQLARGNAAEAETAFRKAVEVAPKSVQAHLGLGNFLWNTNRRDEAVKAFDAALALDPKDVLANRLIASFHATGPTPEKAEVYFVALADADTSGTGRMQLAEYYLRMRKLPEARKALDLAAGRKETSVAANRRIAGLDFAQDRKADAYRRVDDLLKATPKDADTLVLKARMLSAGGKPNDALEALKQAVAAQPNNVSAQYELGTAYAARRQSEPAIAAFSEVLRLNPRASAAQVQLSNLYLSQGQVKQSATMAEDALRNAPGNPLARLVRARTLMVQGQSAEAGRLMGELQKDYPKAWPVLAQQGTYFYTQRDFAKARALWSETIALNPRAYEAQQGLLRLDLIDKKPDAAWDRVSRLVEQYPTDGRYRLEQARIALARRDAPAAEGALKKAIEVDPSLMDAYGLLAQVYLAQNKLDEARTGFEALLKQRPRATGPRTVLGMILQQQGKRQEAMEQYQRAVDADPKAGVAANNLAWLMAESGGNLDQALALAQTATQVMPEQPEVNDTVGMIYLKKEQPQLAIPPMVRAVEKDPTNATYRYRLGQAYAAAGDRTRARQELERAIADGKTFPEAAEARKLLASVK